MCAYSDGRGVKVGSHVCAIVMAEDESLVFL